MNKRYYFLAVFLFLILGNSIYAHDGRSVERKQNFDKNWRFQLGDLSDASRSDFVDNHWRKLDLPHDWSVEGTIDSKNPMGNDGGYFPAGIGWYRKSFTVPQSYTGKQVSIYFEGVYMNAQVYINGKELGVRPYGYSSFSYDLTPYLKLGTENTIAVRVDNSAQKNSRWYTGSGIYRHVWLMVKESIHIEQWGIAIKTPEVSEDYAKVSVSASVANKTAKNRKVRVLTTIFDKDKKAVSKNIQQINLSANSTDNVVQVIPVKNPKLWSPDAPTIYTAQVEILDGKRQLDRQLTPFGIRTIAYSAEQGFLLNGKQITINGGCVHHDNGALGAAAYDRAEYRKAELFKEAGFNAVRSSHNPPSEAFLDACDRLGLLVMNESFDGWRESKTKYDYAMHFDTWWQRDIAAMVLRDRNHPSIFAWSTGNEIIERKKPEAVETAKMLKDYIKQLDDTRPVTSAITTWDSDWEILDPLFAVHDIGGYNYQMHRAARDHKRVPSRIILQTESYPRDAFSNWKAVHDNSYIIGDFVWTAMDYLGEAGIGRYFYKGETEGQHYERDIYPWHGAYCGDIDLIGIRKPISYYRDLLYNEDKKLFLAVREPNHYFGEINETMWSVWPTWESWNWPGQEGKPIEVEVYSRYPAVRLYLDDRFLGEMLTGEQEQFKAVFTIPFQKGVLKAVGVDNAMEVAAVELRSAGAATQIRLLADRDKIDAHGQDLSFITVEVTDEQGILDPLASHRFNFTLDGPGEIIAVSNADLQDKDSYVGTERKAWKGRAQVVVKSTGKGKIQLTTQAEGLNKGIITIESQ